MASFTCKKVITHYTADKQENLTTPDTNNIVTSLDLFFSKAKVDFLDFYSKLTNVDKFYSLFVILDLFTDVKGARFVLMDELKPDLITFKHQNNGLIDTLPNGGKFTPSMWSKMNELSRSYQKK